MGERVEGEIGGGDLKAEAKIYEGEKGLFCSCFSGLRVGVSFVCKEEGRLS